MTGMVDSNIHTLGFLGELVAPSSRAVAVRQGDAALSYAELHRRAALVSAELRARGVAAGTTVAVCLRDATWLIPTIIGILRAGMAYLPIEATWPSSRWAEAVRTAGTRHVFVEDDTAELVRPTGLEPVPVGSLPGSYTTDGGMPAPFPTGPAYLILTSGSTGAPKVVAVGHKAAAQSLRARSDVYQNPIRGFLWHSPSAFDSSVAGLFWTLAEGGTLVVPKPDERADPARLLALIREHEVSHVLCLPRVWREVLRLSGANDLEAVSTVIVAGEAVIPPVVAEHAAACPAELWNEYGPAEAAVWSTVHRCDPVADTDEVPIGRGRPGVTTHVVRPDLTECNPGEEGELLLSGPALAWGYAGSPGTTAEHFVPSPFLPGERAYRTGDRAVRRADERLVFRGRLDEEVKISGVRVSPAEVERSLLAAPGVGEAAVVAQPVGQDRVMLTGFVVAASEHDGSLDPARVRGDVTGRLPAVMVPARIEVLPALPRGATGKVDRAALVELADAGAEADLASAAAGPAPSYGEPGSPGAPLDTVLTVWRSVLRNDELTAETDLFAAGGDSISAVMISARLRERGLDATPFDIFRERTPRQVATLLAGRPVGDAPLDARETAPVPALPEQEPPPASMLWLPLLPVQRWFIHEAHASHLDHWNFSFGLSVEEGEPDLVRAALAEVAERHPMPAARFSCDGDPADPTAWRMRPGAGTVPMVIEFVDGDPHGSGADELVKESQSALSVREGPLARLLWIESSSGPARPRAVLIAHHLVMDAVSVRMILADLAAVVARRSDRRTGPALQVGAVPRIDEWAWASHDRAVTGAHDDEAATWRRIAEAAGGCLVDAPNGTEREARRTVNTLPAAVCSAFENATRSSPGVAERVLLAALVRALRLEFPAVSVAGVEVENAGRAGVPGSATAAVGWFTTFYPVAVDLSGAEDVTRAHAAASAALAEVPGDGSGYLVLAHGGGPAGTGLAALPPPPVGLNYLGRVETSLSLPEARLRLDPAPPGARSGSARRRHLYDLDVFLRDDEMVLTWTHPAGGVAAGHLEKLAAHVGEGIRACLEVEVTNAVG